MPTNEEQRAIQKRVLTMLIKAEKDPSRLAELIEEYSIEMQQEDVAFVEKRLNRRAP